MNHRLVADTQHGIRRTLGVAQTRRKQLTRDRIVKILGVLEGLIAAARDKALVLIGFVGSLWRSELAALRVEHLAWHSKVMHCPLRRARIAALGAAQSGEVQGGRHFRGRCSGHNVNLGQTWASGYAHARLPADAAFFRRIVRAPSTLYANLLGI